MATHTSQRARIGNVSRAFTLVELLVVIGIIAVLIGILLPSLSAARRSAQQVKCAAALQEIGLCFQMYSNDNKGYFPVAKCSIPSYAVGDTVFNANGVGSAYWFNFLADYAVANHMGYAIKPNDALQGHHSILWGCPAWEGYQGANASETQPGYGMNGFPTFDADLVHPPLGEDEPKDRAGNVESCIIGTSATTYARFYKQSEWTHAGERGLVGDSLFWFMESLAVAPQQSYPPGIVPQVASGNNVTWTNSPPSQQTEVDIYRHGRKPGTTGSGTSTVYDPNGGKVGYNLLFCDGHVQELSEAKTAYSAMRMRFPL